MEVRSIKNGKNNPNWKGGITKFRTADELLTMSEEVRSIVLERLNSNLIQILSDREGGGCWDWVGPVFSANGRAKLTLGTNFLASRLMYVLYKGSTGGLCVLHSCDNVLCVNPNHLFIGTNAENSTDMVTKGRQAKGENNGGSKLTTEQVEEIREFVKANGLRRHRLFLSNKYKVGKEAISRIVSKNRSRRTWK